MFLNNGQTLNIDEMTCLNYKKIDTTGSIKPFDWWQANGHPHSDEVRVYLPTSTKLKILHTAMKINHRNS